ncbi:MAG: PHP domain-containing protein, partial [Bryobacterales bacterium]|nr:PHP domain-containing protein [Bryobacterales bacterium]
MGRLPFVELRARSSFSFLEGGSNPEDLILAAANRNLPAMALLDRDGLYGAPRFHMAAQKAGIRAHIGAEVTCVNGHRVPLLCESREGYQNLCQLLTRIKLRVPKNDPKLKPAATLDELREFRAGLICLDPSFVSIYGAANTYAELQRHYDPDQEARNLATIEFARHHRIPLVATNGVAYATPAERAITDALTCIRHHTTLDGAGRLLHRNSERYVKPAEEMAALFAGYPEALRNTVEISHRLGFSLQDLGYEFPRYPVPGVAFPPSPRDMAEYLRTVTDQGARRRYVPYHDKAQRQIERELALIEKLELSGYFLIVWDIVEFCRREKILAQGRGSAANSAVCYSLGITAVDPVGMELLFERFLSEERGEWPDIDIDLPSGNQRERAIQYVYNRYGPLGAAMTANVITYRGRSAAREMGKVLGFDEETCARLSAVAPSWGWKEAGDSPQERFRKAGFDLADPRYRHFLRLYEAAQDLPRHLGQHSGGMVICQGQLDRVVPLEPASMPGRVVVQWDKEDCADLGLIKVDLL